AKETAEKGLTIDVYVDNGSCKTKFDCHHKMINFSHSNTNSFKELTYKEVVSKIKMQFGDEFPGIMDNNHTVNVKWKLVSFKEAHVILADNSKDIQILDDSSLQEEFLDESDSENSSDEDGLSTPNTKFLVRKIVEFTPVETKVIGIETEQLVFCWKMTNDSLKAIENNMKRYNEKELQFQKMTSQTMWWFN
ncbi:hypothetical protein RFI_36806, partial [Reticulomyxa filosa]